MGWLSSSFIAPFIEEFHSSNYGINGYVCLAPMKAAPNLIPPSFELSLSFHSLINLSFSFNQLVNGVACLLCCVELINGREEKKEDWLASL